MAGKISLVFLVVLLLIMTLGIAFLGDKIPFIKQSDSQITTPTSNPNSAQLMQVYTNTQYGFRFEYPKDWQIQEIDSKNEKVLHSILQITPNGFKGNIPPIKLLYAPNPKKLSLQNLEKTFNNQFSGVPIVYSSDDEYQLSGSGIPTYFRQDGLCITTKCQIYTFSKDDKVYQFVNFPDVLKSSQQNDYFNQIFNTFTFTFKNTPTPVATSSGLKN